MNELTIHEIIETLEGEVYALEDATGWDERTPLPSVKTMRDAYDLGYYHALQAVVRDMRGGELPPRELIRSGHFTKGEA